MPRAPARDVRLDGSGYRIGIAVARFHHEIANAMVADARARADALGVEVVAVLDVSGVYDLPLVAHGLAAQKDIDGVVALGCVITGQTRHDDLITHAAAKALLDVSLVTEKPVGLGVTGPGQTEAQAKARVDRAGAAVEAVVRSLRSLGRSPAGRRKRRV